MNYNLFGQYRDRKTIIHNLDPRVKVISVFILSTLILFMGSWGERIALTCMIVIFMAISRIRVAEALRALRPFMFIFLFIMLMYMVFSSGQLMKGFIASWRFLAMILVTFIFTYTTSVASIVFAIEKIAWPIKSIRKEPRDIALMLSAAIRFIPLLFIESGIIRDAQRSRGASRHRHISGFMRAIISKTFFRGLSLADAVLSRGYAAKHTWFREHKIMSRDYAALTFLFVLSVAVYL